MLICFLSLSVSIQDSDAYVKDLSIIGFLHYGTINLDDPLPPPLNPANSAEQPHIMLHTVITQQTAILTLRVMWEQNRMSRNWCKQ